MYYDERVLVKNKKKICFYNKNITIEFTKQSEIEVSKSSVNMDKAVLDKKLLAQSMLYEVFEKQDSTLVSRKINIKKSNNNFNAEISYIFNENIAQTSELSVTD